MKRISFKDSGGLNLTQAVLSGRKTMTRRAVIEQVERDAMVYAEGKSEFTRVKFEYILKHSPYKVGDVVAIQQAYRDALKKYQWEDEYFEEMYEKSAGWTNKMFVKAELMPHHIRITDVRVERLRDILDEDCLREGVLAELDPLENGKPAYDYYFDGHGRCWYNTPREAFAALIDKVSGRGTWNSNPLVWAYSFELVD